ncbi:MAG: hypothetical protein LBV41_01870 [Cytophagaceae bacterium]|jgi:hypothetical protein|nr:hypothetical protein [Cytophagaceae bacterium]
MKVKYLAVIALSLLFMMQGCKRELPYPIDEVKRGVVIDVVRISGTDGVLSAGQTTGDYRLKLAIPKEQGDYSFMKNAQLLAILRNADGNYSTTVAVDNITGFPKEIPIDIADVYSKLGLTAPELGQMLYFTTNVVLNDGSTIPGWTEFMGFNNRAFAGWLVDGRAYSSNVVYAATCPLELDNFVGTFTVSVDEWWGETPYPVEVTKISDTELNISGICDGVCSNDLVITIDPTDHSISFGKQILEPNSGEWFENPAYFNFALSAGIGRVDACDISISFSATATVDAGSFGAVSFAMKKN